MSSGSGSSVEECPLSRSCDISSEGIKYVGTGSSPSLCSRHPFNISLSSFQAVLADLVSDQDPASLARVTHVTCNGWHGVPNPARGNNLSSHLTQLEGLEFENGTILLSPKDIESFSAFKSTLKYITLMTCNISTSTLVSLLNYFPFLERLYLSSVYRLDSDEYTPLNPRKPLKELILYWNQNKTFLDLLGDLSTDLQVNEVVFKQVQRGYSKSLFKLVTSTFGASIKRLKLHLIRAVHVFIPWGHLLITFS